MEEGACKSFMYHKYVFKKMWYPFVLSPVTVKAQNKNSAQPAGIRSQLIIKVHQSKYERYLWLSEESNSHTVGAAATSQVGESGE